MPPSRNPNHGDWLFLAGTGQFAFFSSKPLPFLFLFIYLFHYKINLIPHKQIILESVHRNTKNTKKH